MLYPPVKTGEFQNRNSFDQREDKIVMISRISPEKRIEKVIKAISQSETRPFLEIFGGFSTKNSKYLKSLVLLAEKLNVKIKIHSNSSRKELKKGISSSKIFIHPMEGEHFGISVVEAMAGGCPVIVHKSGGPYKEVIKCGKYGLYFTTIKDLANKIDSLIIDKKKWNKYHNFSIKRAKEFDEKKFSKKMLRMVENLI